MRVFHNVWCAGSACSFYDVATKCRTRLTHHDGSVATGRIAGHNMSSKFSGECSRPFYRQPIHWIDIGNDIGIENVGRIDSNLSIETILLYGNESQSVNNAEQAILFYKKDGYVVGILLWNIMGRLRVARQILYERHLNPNLKELTRRIMNHDESDFINSKNDDTEESDEANAASVFK
ncbi:hypothetical protein GJ496_000382 [Pomphorhynchus laevis]|nr:hypothetical protein GJ496_000382 [Pomphorhynchus laevis]